MPKENPADPNSKSVEAQFENLTSYKNRNGGVWGRGEMHVFRNLKSADNAIGFTSSTGSFGDDLFTSLVVDSLFVGETENIGNPVTPEEKAYGRSLPKRLIPDYPIHAYEYYDYRHDVVNTTFVNFRTTNSADQERFHGCCLRAPGLPPKTPSRVRSSSMPSPCTFENRPQVR